MTNLKQNNNRQLTKTNSTKAQRRAQAMANQRAALMRKPIPRPIAMKNQSNAIAHYKHCVLGPVSMPSSTLGYPDGDARASVTLDYRRVYVMKPTSGNISFGLAASTFGCFIKGVGTLTTDTSSTLTSIDPGDGSLSMSAGTSFNDLNRGMLPVSAPTTLMNVFGSARPIVAVCDVNFTGSTMQNGGSVTIAKAASPNAPGGSLASTERRQLYEPSQINPVMSGTAVVGPARESYTSRVVPPHPDYQPLTIAAVDALQASPNILTNSLAGSGTGNNYKVCSFPSPDAGVVWYSYSGLDATASITVSVRFCIQYTLQSTSAAGDFLAPLAKPSPPPPANPGLFSAVYEKITSSPAALTFVANAFGHLVPQAKPLIAIAASAYNHH